MSNPGAANSAATNFQSLIGLPLTEAQFASPPPQILANTTALYQRSDGSLWQSNGVSLGYQLIVSSDGSM